MISYCYSDARRGAEEQATKSRLSEWVRELSTDPQHAFPGHG